MYNILRILFLIAMVAALVVAVYYLFYSRRINEKIAGGVSSGRPMIDIPSLVRVAAFAALIIYAVILTVAVISGGRQQPAENRDSFSVIDLTDYTYRGYSGSLVCADASYAKIYSKDSNAGYEKQIVRDGDFTFTAFTRTGAHDVYHPDFFCFVDYTGAQSDEFFMYDYYEYIDCSTAQTLGGIGSGGGCMDGSFLVIGNINEAEQFQLTLSLLDGKGEDAYFDATDKALEADQGKFPAAAEFAFSTGRVVIAVE